MSEMSNIKFKNVDEYISTFSPNVKKLLESLRQTIQQAAPEAAELISYNMPAFKFHGILVYYAAHKEHIGFYPGNSTVIEIFKNDLVSYKTSKGTIQFPVEKTIPLNLVKKIVQYRVNQNLERAKTKGKL
ncbi:MAG: iron chaperone [Methanococcaceae archaeon]